jgi:hypothetical protein
MHPSLGSIPEMQVDSSGARAMRRAELTYQGVTIAVMLWVVASLWMLR